MIAKFFITTFLLPCFISCGANLLSVAETEDPAQDAINAMENNRPEEAITILEDALANDPGNPQLTSLLASAIAQKHGFDPLAFAFDLAEQQSSTSSENGITSMFGALPEPTDENIAGIQLAIATLDQIAADDKSAADNFKLSLLHTANMSLLTKKVGSITDGNFSVEDIQNMSDAEAAAILTALLNASSSLVDSNAEGENSSKAKEEIEAIQAAIDSQEGATDAEKLKNYLGAQEES